MHSILYWFYGLHNTYKATDPQEIRVRRIDWLYIHFLLYVCDIINKNVFLSIYIYPFEKNASIEQYTLDPIYKLVLKNNTEYTFLWSFYSLSSVYLKSFEAVRMQIVKSCVKISASLVRLQRN